MLPLFFDLGADGVRHSWIAMSKRSLVSLTAMYSSGRMVHDYIANYYEPLALRNQATHDNNMALTRHLAAWKQNIPTRFNTVSIDSIVVNGVNGDTIVCGNPLNVRVRINQGELNDDEVLAQLVIGPVNAQGEFVVPPDVLRLTYKALPHNDNGDSPKQITFEGTYIPTGNGRYSYGIRIMPITPGLESPLDSGLVLWG